MEVIKLAKNLEQYNDSIWHAGKVAIFKCDKGTYNLYANGIVKCSLIAKRTFKDYYQNEYKEGEIIQTVVDKNNDGLFLNKMCNYITDDKHLYKIIEGNDPDYKLEFENNNWLELEFINKDGEVEYDDLILDDSCITDAIDKIASEIKQEKTNSKYAIYCRSAYHNGNPDTCYAQKDYCIEYIKSKYNCEEKDIEVYMDDGFSGININRPSFKKLMETIKLGNIKTIFIPDFSRLCRDLPTSLFIIEELKKYDVDLYSIKEESSLKELSLAYNSLNFMKLNSKDYAKDEDEMEMDYE